MLQNFKKKRTLWTTLEGKERESNIYRTTLQTSRVQLFKGVFTGRIRKIILLNFLLLVSFLPMIIVLIFGILNVMNQGFNFPFSSNLGMGWPAQPETAGIAEKIILHNIILYGAIMLATSLFSAVGISGTMQVFRNLLWSKAGDIHLNEFFKGIRQTLLTLLPIVLIYFAGIYALLIATQYVYVAMATTTHRVGWIFLLVFTYSVMALMTIFFFWQISINANYKVNLLQNIYLSLFLTFRFILSNLIFLVIALLPFVFFLLNNSFFTILILMITIFFSFSFCFLVWQSYAHWLFDNLIEAVKLQKNSESGDKPLEVVPVIKNKNKVLKYSENLGNKAVEKKSNLFAIPIPPIEDKASLYHLPEDLSVLDLKKLQLSKLNIEKSVQDYQVTHAGDEEFVVYNAQFNLSQEVPKSPKKKK